MQRGHVARTALTTVVMTAVMVVALGLDAGSASAQLAKGSIVQQGMRARFDVDSAIARATMLRRQNRRPEAAAVMKQALAVAPEREDVRALHALLQHDLHGGEALAAIDYRTWRTQRPDWREAAFVVRQNTTLGPFVARASQMERSALRDERLELELYPAFPRGYLALGGSVATDASLYARTTASAEIFGSLAERVEGSLGYRRMNFDSGVDLLGGSIGTYVGSFLLGTRVTHVLGDGGTGALFSARRFLTDDGQYVGVKLATGSVPVLLRTPTDFEVRFTQSVAAEARVVMRGLVVLTAEAELGRDGLSGGGSSEYQAVRVGVGLRY
jgi:YaiO family outer membrane protein